MYVTRFLSMYKRNPGALSDPPPPGPYSGYLVIYDESNYYFLDDCVYENHIITIRDLPLPQSKDLTCINYARTPEKVLFVPVLNQPLSSNRYYMIKRTGKHQGLASTSSKEEDLNMNTCLCYSTAKDVKPRPLDPSDDYQQFEIIKNIKGFKSKSVAQDGIPACLLSRKDWKLHAETPNNYHLDRALGSNDSLRTKLPDFDFPVSNYRSESVIVGRWYCPFMFVKEGMKLKEQMKKSVFYELTLHQRWERRFSMENKGGKNHDVLIDVVFETEFARVGGRKVVWDEDNGVDDNRVVWFKSFDDVGSETSVGLRLEVVEGMKWEQERFGWIAGNERKVRVERLEKFGGINKWRKFRGYVLIETFVLKGMDGRLVLTYHYLHTHQIRCKWE